MLERYRRLSFSTKKNRHPQTLGLLGLILGLVLSACQMCPAPPRLVLIGQPVHTNLAANLLGVAGIKTQQTTALTATDVVLIVVSAVDGPMPQTREQIEAIRGQARGPAAIFLVRVNDQPDPDLRQLVLVELRELLTSNGQPGVATLPVLYDNDPNVTLTIRGFLAVP